MDDGPALGGHASGCACKYIARQGEHRGPAQGLSGARRPVLNLTAQPTVGARAKKPHSSPFNTRTVMPAAKNKKADPREEDLFEPLIAAWDELGLSTTDQAFDRQWSQPTNEAFNKLWVYADPLFAVEARERLYQDFQRRDLSRFGQLVFRQAYVCVRFLDHIENHADESASADVARCAVMFYAGLHFGKDEVEFWTLYHALSDAAVRVKSPAFPTHASDTPPTPATEADRVVAEAWTGIEWLYRNQYLPRWRPNFSASVAKEPAPFSADLIFAAKDLRD